jgi:murein DD-endopeptidase MepM/ murein hydrolase activator NlpD
MKIFNLTLIFFLIVCPVFTQNRAQLEQERLQIIEKIDFISGILKKNVIDKENTLLYFKSLQLQIGNREKILKNLKQQISVLNSDIAQKQKTLDTLELNKNQLKEKQSRLIRSNYLNSITKNKYLFLFSSKGWDDYLDRKRYIKQYNQFIRTELGSLDKQEKAIQKILNEISKNKTEIEKLALIENANLTKLNEESGLKTQILNNLNSNESKYRTILNSQKIQREQLNKSIEKIIIDRLKNSNGSKAVPDIIAGTENFSTYKSKLSWPVSKGFISSGFGRHSHPGMPGVYTNNSGVDIITNPNETVRAVFDGDVAGLMYINGYNWMVIVRHGEYYSVYSKLQSVNISKGDNITKNQPLGKIGDNGEFHFEIWHLKTKLNPEIWLNKSLN